MNLSTLERKLVTLALDPGGHPEKSLRLRKSCSGFFDAAIATDSAFLRELAASGNNGHGDEISWRRQR